jgi:hypothetical protein
LGLSHQLCISHVRKNVAKSGAHSILEQARGESDEQDEKLKKLEEDLKALKGLLIRACRGRRQKDRAVAPRIPVGCPAHEERAKDGESLSRLAGCGCSP